MKGAVPRQGRTREEVPVPPIPVVQPPELSVQIDKEAQEVTEDPPRPVSPRADLPAPRPPQRSELPTGEPESPRISEEVANNNQGSNGSNLPKENPDTNKSSRQLSNEGRPRRSARLPRYLQDFEL